MASSLEESRRVSSQNTVRFCQRRQCHSMDGNALSRTRMAKRT